MITLVIWAVFMVAALASAAAAIWQGYHAVANQRNEQLHTDEMLARKHVRHLEIKLEAGSFATATSTATLLVKEGADGDTAEAEKADD